MKKQYIIAIPNKKDVKNPLDFLEGMVDNTNIDAREQNGNKYRRYEALDWYEKGCMVYERHTTTTQPTTHTQMQSCVTLRWYGDSKKYEV